MVWTGSVGTRGACAALAAVLSCGLVTLGCGDDCSDAYPVAPAGATSLLHVTSCGEGSGSANDPYGSISEALTAANNGTAVLVAPGNYSENLVVDKAVTIVGTTNPADPAAAEATIEAPAAHAVRVSASATIQGLHLSAPAGTGFWIDGASGVVIEGCRVEGAASPPSAPFGYGVLAVDSALELRTSSVSGSAAVGVLYVRSSGTVEGNAISANLAGGLRIEEGDAGLTVSDNTASGNQDFGMAALSARGIIIVENKVLNTLMGGTSGDGILVTTLMGSANGTDVQLDNNTVSASARLGVLVSGDVGGSITGNTLEGNGVSEQAGFGGGLWVQAGAGVNTPLAISSNQLLDNPFVGLGLTEGAVATVDQNTVRGTLEGTVVDGIDIKMVGDGIALFDTAAATLTSNTVEGSFRAGIMIDGANGTASSLSGNTISGNQIAIVLQDQTDLVASTIAGANTINGNTSDTVEEATPGTYQVQKKQVDSPAVQLGVP